MGGTKNGSLEDDEASAICNCATTRAPPNDDGKCRVRGGVGSSSAKATLFIISGSLLDTLTL